MTSVLLIEDDLTFSRILEGFLQKHGYQVTTHHTGKDGLKTFQSKSFDLVLLDYRLPDTTGMDMLVEIKKTHPDTAVIIMTSFSDIRTAVKVIKLGAFEYITKPVNPEELLMIVQQSQVKDRSSVSKKKATPLKQFVQGKGEASRKLHDYM
jgi:two-component system response regulator HydG